MNKDLTPLKNFFCLTLTLLAASLVYAESPIFKSRKDCMAVIKHLESEKVLDLEQIKRICDSKDCMAIVSHQPEHCSTQDCLCILNKNLKICESVNARVVTAALTITSQESSNKDTFYDALDIVHYPYKSNQNAKAIIELNPHHCKDELPSEKPREISEEKSGVKIITASENLTPKSHCCIIL